MNPLADPACPTCAGAGILVLDPERFPPTRLVTCGCVVRRTAALEVERRAAASAAGGAAGGRTGSTPLHRPAPFRPGRSRYAADPDGRPVGCGLCGAPLELRSSIPVLEQTSDGRWVRRYDYQCPDHAPAGGCAYYELLE